MYSSSTFLRNNLEYFKRDWKYVSPVDVGIAYGIPSGELPANLQSIVPTRSNVSFNIPFIVKEMKQLFSFQVSMVDFLRKNRKINTDIGETASILKRIPVFGELYKDKPVMPMVIHHGGTKGGVPIVMPVPLEFIKEGKPYSRVILNGYERSIFGSHNFVNTSDFSSLVKSVKGEVGESFFSEYIGQLLENISLSSDFAFLRIIFSYQGSSRKIFSVSIPIMFKSKNFRDTIFNAVSSSIDNAYMNYNFEESGVIVIMDIIIETVNKVPYSETIRAFGQKIKGSIKGVFEPKFPFFQVCLFECFLYIDTCKQKPLSFKEYLKVLGLSNLFAYQYFVISQLFSIETSVRLRESCIDGNLRNFWEFAYLDYGIKIGVFDGVRKRVLFEGEKEDLWLVWNHFHVYVITGESGHSPNIIKNEIYTLTQIVPNKLTGEENKATTVERRSYVLDIETLVDDEAYIYGNQSPYLLILLGCTRDEKTGKYETHYFWGLDCIKQFLDFLPELFIANEVVIWAHNGARFDYKFILSKLMKDYHVNIVGDHTKVISFSVKNVIFRDFILFFNFSLNYLAGSWFGDEKLDFDHNVKKEDLEDPIFEAHSKEYCLKDCDLLRRMVTTFEEIVANTLFNGKKLSPCNFWTAPKLALTIFRECFLDETHCLVGASGKDYEIERESFFWRNDNSFSK